MVPQLETKRLILRPLSLDDAPEIQRIFPHWEVIKFLGTRVPWPYPADGVLTYYREAALPAMERGDEWHWNLRLKSTPEQPIGTITLRKGDKNRGFWLGLDWQRQGLMTEAADAVTAFWFDVLGFPVMRIPKAVVNIGSRRISEKSGMRVVATIEKDYVCGRLSTEIWEITAEEWRTHRQQQSAG